MNVELDFLLSVAIACITVALIVRWLAPDPRSQDRTQERTIEKIRERTQPGFRPRSPESRPRASEDKEEAQLFFR